MDEDAAAAYPVPLSCRRTIRLLQGARPMVEEHFDAVVIGSGFGGSVSAYRLAEAGWTVCVLERGKRWPSGSFARTPAEMAANFWDPSEGGHGIFNFWSFRRMEALVASGLGGGSLVYANVLLPMEESWFVDELAAAATSPGR